MIRGIKLLRQRYFDWLNWRNYTNLSKCRQLAVLFGLVDTTMFDIFRHAWKEK